MGDATEDRNLQAIYGLNQRGGRTLSITDLMDAGTIDARMAALCWVAIEQGESFLAGAVPGGAGKTTLMGSLLGFLPPGEPIVTTSSPEVTVSAARGEFDEPTCLLAHEIGSGPWHAYIWGREAAQFFRAGQQGCRCVSCLHADTPSEVQETADQCGIAGEDLEQVGMQLFMWLGGSRMSPVRRVDGLYLRMDGELEPVFGYDNRSDEHKRVLPEEQLWAGLAQKYDRSADELQDIWEERCEVLRGLQADGVRDFEEVRGAVLDAYGE